MEDNNLIYILFTALVIGSFFLGGIVLSSETVKEVPVFNEKLVFVNCSEPANYVLTQSDYEEDVEEALTLELSLESIDSRDLYKSVYDALVLYGEDIESYKDITDISYEYEVNSNEVEFEHFKVRYFIDGDKDESEKALFDDFSVEVDDLDFDDLSEAEINEDYMDSLQVSKVY